MLVRSLALSCLLVAGCGLVDRNLDQGQAVVVLNELLAKASEGDDWVELLNTGLAEVELDGMGLSDGAPAWVLPDGTTLQPGELLVIVCDGTGVEGKADLKLSSDGETVFLVDAEGRTVDEVEFGPQEEDVSWGRYPDGTGDWGPMEPSPGEPNDAPDTDG